MYFTFRKEDDMIVASKVNIKKKIHCLTESLQENITKNMFHISIIAMLSVFFGSSYCLFTSHRHYVCLRRHLELLKFLEIHGQKRFPVFLKGQFSTTKFISLFTSV